MLPTRLHGLCDQSYQLKGILTLISENFLVFYGGKIVTLIWGYSGRAVYLEWLQPELAFPAAPA